MLEYEKISETFSTLPPDKLDFESLVIEDNSVESHCWRAEVLKDLRKFQRLRIEDSSRTSADDLARIIKDGYCLRELSLSYSQLTEDLLRVIARENVSLQTMRVEAHTDTKPLVKISDSAWATLEDDEDCEVVLAPPVTHLYLGGSPSSRIIRRVSESCPRLVELVINSCSSGIIDKELLMTARGCPELSAIGLGDCEVTCSALVQFAKICKQRLQILYVWETSLIEDENFDIADAVSNVSSSLGRSWTPEYVPPW